MFLYYMSLSLTRCYQYHSPRWFEIVDLTVGVGCESALDSPNQGRVLPTSLAI